MGDGEPAVITQPTLRVLLSVLALSANRVVAAGALIEALWGEEASRARERNLHAQVYQLRRRLAELEPGAGAERLVTAPPGYRLVLGPGELDVAVFQALAARGRAALRAGLAGGGGPVVAGGLLGQALGLWRGQALADVAPACGRLEAEAAVLEEQRLAVAEDRADADLAAGLHVQLAAELAGLAGQYPLRERLRGLLMVALYRSGRQAEALESYAQARQILGEELGLDPGPALQALHQQILRSDPALDPPPPPPVTITAVQADEAEPGTQAAVPAAPVAIVPRQLPAGVRHFSGREAELADLQALLAGPGPADQPGGTVMIVAITGAAGVGKTALALHWAHAVAGGFADGQLFVNLRGFDPAGPPVTAEEAVRGFLDALGVPAEQVPAGPDAQAGLYRSLLAGRRMLIVLDNAADPAQVRPLLPASAGCLVIVTSRSSLAGLAATDGAVLVALDVLGESEAEGLLAARLGEGRLAAEPAAAGQIIGLCARLPLALAVTAARAAAVPGLALSALAAELAGESAGPGAGGGPDLDALDSDDAATSIRAVFSVSIRALTEAGRRCFMLLGIHPGPDITWPATVSLTGLDPRTARRALAELVTASLLTEQQPGRWAFHDLLRAYAAEQAAAADPSGQLRDTALTAALDHYLQTAYTAALELEPTRTPIPAPVNPPAPGVQPETLSSRAQAQAWFRAEHQVLIQLLAHAAATGHHTHAWQLQWCLDGFLEMEGHWQDTELANRIALEAATALGDHAVLAHAHQSIGRAAYLAEDLDEAVEHHRRALSHAVEAGDLTRQALAHHGLSLLAEELGDGDEALHHGEQAVELARATGDRVGEAYYLSKVGLISVMLGEHDKGIAECQRALDLQRELGDAADVGFAQANLGRAYRVVGRHADAIDSLRECIALEQEVGNQLAVAFNLRCLGEVHLVAGDPAEAVTAMRLALQIYELLPGMAEADELRVKIGEIEAEMPAGPVGEAR